MTTATQGKRDLDEAIQLLKDIKSEFIDTPETYREFLIIMQICKLQQIDAMHTFRLVSKLFEGKKKLITGFQRFLILPENINIGIKTTADSSQNTQTTNEPAVVHDDSFNTRENIDISEHIHCSLCGDMYSSSSSTRPKNDNDPIKSKECTHTICFSCFQMMHATAMQRTGPHRVWMKCPFCRTDKAFHGRRPIVDQGVCLLVKTIKSVGNNHRRVTGSCN